MAADRALLDTGVLVAFLHGDDGAHERAVKALRSFHGTLLTTESVLTDSIHLLSKTNVGPSACVEFFLREGALLVPASRASLARCRLILERNAQLPIAYTDATLAALAEDTDTWTILTFQRQRFYTLRGPSGTRFRVRP